MKAEIAARLAARQKQFLSFLRQLLGDRGAAEDVSMGSHFFGA
jgi:hypothetical protein